MSSVEPLDVAVTIAAVERETGLSKDTLRIWERRYGFPNPLRDANGERLYPAEQLEKLRLIRHLMDQGMRPGKIVAAPLPELAAHMGVVQAASTSVGSESGPASEVIALLKAHAVTALRETLSLYLARLGLQRFVIEVVAPLNVAIGQSWAEGGIAVFEEHLYSEQVQHLLRQAIGALPAADQRPRILLTTLPGEEHQIGLLMAQACLAVEGAQCISLGVQTPVRDIVLAARAHQVDIVALSFSPVLQVNAAWAMLADVRQVLDAGIALWAGGSLWQRSRRTVEGVRTLGGLTDIPAELAAWRELH